MRPGWAFLLSATLFDGPTPSGCVFLPAVHNYIMTTQHFEIAAVRFLLECCFFACSCSSADRVG